MIRDLLDIDKMTSIALIVEVLDRLNDATDDVVSLLEKDDKYTAARRVSRQYSETLEIINELRSRIE